MCVIQGGAGLDAVARPHPASDLRLARATVVGVRVAAETGAEELVLGNRLQRPLAREAGDIRRGNPTSSGAKPRDSIFGVREHPSAMVGRRSLPEVEFRLQGHTPIVAPGSDTAAQ